MVAESSADRWDEASAAEWKMHCQTDLKNENKDIYGHDTQQSVQDALTEWIRDAILAGDRIFYKYHRDDEVPNWRAEIKRRRKKMWVITVTGPGF